MSIATLPFILFLRLAVMIDFGILPEKVSFRFFNKKEFYRQIHEDAGGRPVVFTNSFQKPSLYWFFTGEPSYTHNNYRYRKNQYDLWDMEAALQGKEVLYFPDRRIPGSDTLHTLMGDVLFHDTEYFCQFNRVGINLPALLWEFEAGEQFEISLELSNPTKNIVEFSESCTLEPWLVYTIFSENERDITLKAQYNAELPTLGPGEKRSFPVEIIAPDVPGEYQIMFSFGGKNMTAGIHGRPIKMIVLSTSTGNSAYN